MSQYTPTEDELIQAYLYYVEHHGNARYDTDQREPVSREEAEAEAARALDRIRIGDKDRYSVVIRDDSSVYLVVTDLSSIEEAQMIGKRYQRRSERYQRRSESIIYDIAPLTLHSAELNIDPEA